MPGMGTQTAKGFTLIETILFLGITGLLILGMMVGAGASLSAQRYRDSVESFKNMLQEQYSDISVVRNGRDNTWNCNENTAVTSSGSTNRGQSDCMIVGKYVRVDADEATIHTVLAVETSTTTRSTEELTLEQNYRYSIDRSADQTYKLDWGSQIAWPKSGGGARSPTTPRTIGIFIMRSPSSGFIYTFSDTDIPADVASINDATFKQLIEMDSTIPGRQSRNICIDGSEAFGGQNMNIYIASRANSASAIETRSNDMAAAVGSTQRC